MRQLRLHVFFTVQQLNLMPHTVSLLILYVSLAFQTRFLECIHIKYGNLIYLILLTLNSAKMEENKAAAVL